MPGAEYLRMTPDSHAGEFKRLSPQLPALLFCQEYLPLQHSRWNNQEPAPLPRHSNPEPATSSGADGHDNGLTAAAGERGLVPTDSFGHSNPCAGPGRAGGIKRAACPTAPGRSQPRAPRPTSAVPTARCGGPTPGSPVVPARPRRVTARQAAPRRSAPGGGAASAAAAAEPDACAGSGARSPGTTPLRPTTVRRARARLAHGSAREGRRPLPPPAAAARSVPDPQRNGAAARRGGARLRPATPPRPPPAIGACPRGPATRRAAALGAQRPVRAALTGVAHPVQQAGQVGSARAPHGGQHRAPRRLQLHRAAAGGRRRAREPRATPRLRGPPSAARTCPGRGMPGESRARRTPAASAHAGRRRARGAGPCLVVTSRLSAHAQAAALASGTGPGHGTASLLSARDTGEALPFPCLRPRRPSLSWSGAVPRGTALGADRPFSGTTLKGRWQRAPR